MFRDLKEYQEIAKIYAEKVSKPENLDENRNQMATKLRLEREANKPAPEPKVKPTYQSNRDRMIQSRSANRPKSREEVGLKPKQSQGRISRSSQNMAGKPKPEPKYKPQPGAVFGQRTNEVGAQGGGKPSEGDFKKDFPDKVDPKPKKMHSIEKKNRARLGDAKVDALKAKNKDFQAMKKGGMSKDDFIKKYPKSITAQKAKGLRDHTEWDAYDMVLEYLFSTEQVESLEEANYVMMEMDQNTIGEIVKEVKEALIDEGLMQPYIKPSMPLLKDKRTGEYMTIDGKPFDLQKFKDDYNKKKEGNMGKDKPKTGK